MNLTTQLLLGLLAGGTIYLGLLAGRWPARHPLLRTCLGMLAAGILVYLLIEIASSAAGQAAAAWTAAVNGTATHGRAFGLSVLLVGGFLLGLVGLTLLQQRLTAWLRARAERRAAASGPASAGGQLALTIASGIGLHNLSEGLAIGQSAAAGRTALAAGLVVGFALHNSTEGFGILGPMIADQRRVPWRSLALFGLIGGGPTFLGVLLGGVWTSQAVDVFVLAMAAGALLYVVGQILGSLRKQAAQVAVMASLAAGFAVGWGTEVVATVALAGNSATAATAAAAGSCSTTMTEADGDVMTMPGSCSSTTAAAAGSAEPTITAAQAKTQDATAAALLHEQPLPPTSTDPDGTVHYTLTASAFPWQLYPGRVVTAWGYNGSVPGPLLRWHVGEKVAVTLVNQLPQATSIHWHGLAVPEAADGDPMTSAAVQPGKSATYTFTVTDQMVGTHWYHSHVNDAYQVDAGLHGDLIVDPAPGASDAASNAHADVDALVSLSAFKVAGSEAENAFTIDGKAYPSAPELTVKQGQRVLLRLVNDSAEETHVMHLHGYTWTQVATDGNPTPPGTDSNNVTLGPGETADMLVVADHPGDWMLQCHVMDHTVNPDNPGGDGSASTMADMGGLITYLHVTPAS